MRAASRSTWLVPMQKQPTAIRRSAGRKASGELRARADAEQMHALQRLPQGVLVERVLRGQVV